MNFVSSCGCPFSCGFCASTRHFSKVRFYNAEYVVREIEAVIERWKPEALSFWDDPFIADRRRTSEIARLIREKGLHKKVEFRVSTRADPIDREILEELNNFNVKGINFGAESGSDHVLQYLKEGRSSVARNQQALDLCQEIGINVGCSFVVGSPPETRADLRMTLEFFRRNRDKLEEANFYPSVAFPLTPLWAWARENGKILDPINWDALSFTVGDDDWWEAYYLLSEHMTRNEFRIMYYLLHEKTMLLAQRKATRAIEGLEPALREQWEQNAEHRRFRGRRAVRLLEKLLKIKDRLFRRK